MNTRARRGVFEECWGRETPGWLKNPFRFINVGLACAIANRRRGAKCIAYIYSRTFKRSCSAHTTCATVYSSRSGLFVCSGLQNAYRALWIDVLIFFQLLVPLSAVQFYICAHQWTNDVSQSRNSFFRRFFPSSFSRHLCVSQYSHDYNVTCVRFAIYCRYWFSYPYFVLRILNSHLEKPWKIEQMFFFLFFVYEFST